MILLEIVMEALPHKLAELEMALLSITQGARSQAGCLNARACRHLTDNDGITIITEWNSREELNRYIAGNDFSALMGTRILLRRKPTLTLYAVAAREDAETIKAVRNITH